LVGSCFERVWRASAVNKTAARLLGKKFEESCSIRTLYTTFVYMGTGPHGLVEDHGENDGYHGERKSQHVHGINRNGYFCTHG